MKRFALGVIVGILAVAGVVYASLAAGLLPVATSAHPLPFEKRLAMMDVDARAKRNMPKEMPIQGGEDNLVSGGNVYIRHCASCHGLPGEARPGIASAMFPPPPELYKSGEGVEGDPSAETYWKITNGIRLSGMPAFGEILSDTERWQVSLFLASPNSAEILRQLEVQQKIPSGTTGLSKPAAVVNMTDDALLYSPAIITIKAGQKVEWKNSSREVHTVTVDPRRASDPRNVELPMGVTPFDSGYLEPGQAYVHTFGTPGTYRYVCTLHEVQRMIGEVIVK